MANQRWGLKCRAAYRRQRRVIEASSRIQINGASGAIDLIESIEVLFHRWMRQKEAVWLRQARNELAMARRVLRERLRELVPEASASPPEA